VYPSVQVRNTIQPRQGGLNLGKRKISDMLTFLLLSGSSSSAELDTPEFTLLWQHA